MQFLTVRFSHYSVEITIRNVEIKQSNVVVATMQMGGTPTI